MEVKIKGLYTCCKNSFLYARKDEILDGEVMLQDHYDQIDETPWGALAAYRHYWSTGYLNRYLLCYEDRIVEIDLNWEPTAEQMAVISQKLGVGGAWNNR